MQAFILQEIKEKYGIDELMEVIPVIEKSLLEVANLHYELDSITKATNADTHILQQFYESEERDETVINLYDKHLEEIKEQDTRDVKCVAMVIGLLPW